MTDLAKQLEEAAREQLEHANEMLDRIDGAEESRGHDSMLTRWATEAERAASLMDQARARLVPEGWVCVPREPTEEMLAAAFEAFGESPTFQPPNEPERYVERHIYIAMIAAVNQGEPK